MFMGLTDRGDPTKSRGYIIDEVKSQEFVKPTQTDRNVATLGTQAIP
jgi:hypothetical protein